MQQIPIRLLFLPANHETGQLIAKGQTNRQAFCKCRNCGHHLKIATGQDQPGPGMIPNKSLSDFFKPHVCPKCKSKSKPRLYLAGIFTGTRQDAHEEEMSEKCIESFKRQWSENELLLRDGHVEQDKDNYGISGPDQDTELRMLDAGQDRIHMYAEWRLFDEEDLENGVSRAQFENAKHIFSIVAGTGFKKTRQRRGLSIQGQIDRKNVERKDGRTIIHDVELHCVSSVPNPAYTASELAGITKSLENAAKEQGQTIDEFFTNNDVPEIIESETSKSMDQAIAIEEANRLFHEGYNTIWSAWHDFYSALDDSEQETEQKLAILSEHWQEMGRKLHALHAQFGFAHEREKAMMEQAMDSPQAITPPGPGETESASSIKQGGHDVEVLLKQFMEFARTSGCIKSEKEITPDEAGLLDQMVEQFFAQMVQQKEQFKEQLKNMLMGNAEPAAPPEEEMQLENPEDKKPEEEEDKMAAKAMAALKKAGYQIIPPKSPANALSEQIAKGFQSFEQKFDAKLKTLEESIQGNRGILNEFIGGTEYAAQLIAEEEKALAKAATVPATPASTITLDASAIEALKGLYNPAAPAAPEGKNGVTHHMLGKAFADAGFIGGVE